MRCLCSGVVHRFTSLKRKLAILDSMSWHNNLHNGSEKNLPSPGSFYVVPNHAETVLIFSSKARKRFVFWCFSFSTCWAWEEIPPHQFLLFSFLFSPASNFDSSPTWNEELTIIFDFFREWPIRIKLSWRCIAAIRVSMAPLYGELWTCVCDCIGPCLYM